MRTGITFAVDDVTPATERLQEHDHLLEARIRAPIAVAPRAFRSVIVNDLPPGLELDGFGDLHPLLGAVHQAYADHRPFVLTPDAIALALAQGVALHVRQNADTLRDRFVRHTGRKTLSVRMLDPTSAADWEKAFDYIAEHLAEELGSGRVNLFTRPLSTTGPLERAACQIALMDAFSRYFDYELGGVCGIPTVTLAGTPADWRDLRARVNALAEWDLGWWGDALRPLCDQWIATAEGNVDRLFWQTMYKSRSLYVAEAATGWIVRLFPFVDLGGDYLRNPFERPGARRTLPVPFASPYPRTQHIAPDAGDKDNPWLHAPLPIRWFPSGLSRVEIRVTDERDKDRAGLFDVIAGFLGVGQAEDGLTLFPQIGWVACESRTRLWEKIEALHVTEPTSPERDSRPSGSCPAFLMELYDRYATVRLWGGALSLRPVETLKSVSLSDELSDLWLVRLTPFADLADGSILAYVNLHVASHPLKWAIVHGRIDGDPASAGFTIVADTPLELFQKLLDGDAPYFLSPRAALKGTLAEALAALPAAQAP